MTTTRSRAALATVAALLSIAVVVAPAPQPPAAEAAGPASVTLEGRGYGHGHGMSQHGAQGAAARHGKTYRQIVGFYYPHTSWGSVRGRIKVLVTGDSGQDLVVRNSGDLVVRQVSGDGSWRLGRTPKRWRLTPANGGASTRVSKLTDRWRAVRTVPGQAEIVGDSGSVALVAGSGSTWYQGSLRSAADGTGRRHTVNVVPLEAYLRGVVPLEVPALWHRHAVRAQAVAARTYAAFERGDRSGYFDVYDTTQSQVYGGLSAAHPASDRAIRATRAEVLTFEGRPAFTQFSSSNGGWLAKGSKPYLVAKQDPWDRWSGNPYRSWRVSLTDNTIENAYPAIGDFRRLRVVRRDGNGTWNGRVVRIRIVGSSGAAGLSGDTFRSVFGLRSTWFRVA